MTEKIYYYARVSSKGQNLDRQIQQFIELGANERDIITEKQSGKDIDNRAAYKAMRDTMLRNGDTLYICSLDRLGRCKQDIKNELEHYKAENIRVKVLDIPTTLIDFPKGQEWVCEMVNNILIEVLGSMAEQERHNIRKRQREGISAAHNKGVKFGRPTAKKPQNWQEVYAEWKRGDITAVQAMQKTGTTKSTFYKFAKEEQAV